MRNLNSLKNLKYAFRLILVGIFLLKYFVLMILLCKIVAQLLTLNVDVLNYFLSYLRI